jgi:vacuolar-type H+-ATPase subunit C/Vma6
MVGGILVGGGIAGAAAIGLGVVAYRRLSGVMPFLFANARISARSRLSLSDAQRLALADKRSLGELASVLGETEFSACAEKATSARELHLALEKALIERIDELREMSPPSFQGVLDAYLWFFEAKVLKAIYRSRFFGRPSPIGAGLVFEVGGINSGLLARLLETETIADINTAMASTHYAVVFEKEYGSLEEFEVALDNHVLSRFTALLGKSKIPDKKHIVGLLETRFDMINIIVLLKCIVRKVSVEERRKLLIKHRGFLGGSLPRMIKSESVQELVEACSSTVYGGAMASALAAFEKDGSLSHFEIELQRLFRKTVAEREWQHLQGPFPLFAYLMRREAEARAFMAASQGIESGFSVEEIRGLLA